MSYQTKTIPITQIISSTDANVNSNNYQGFPLYQFNDNTNYVCKPNPLGYVDVDGSDLCNKSIATFIDFNSGTININDLVNQYGLYSLPNQVQIVCVGGGGGQGGISGGATINLNSPPLPSQQANGATGQYGSYGEVKEFTLDLTSGTFYPWTITVGSVGTNGNMDTPPTLNATIISGTGNKNLSGTAGTQGYPGNSTTFTSNNGTIEASGGNGGLPGNTCTAKYTPNSSTPVNGTTPTPNPADGPTPNISNLDGNYYPAITGNDGFVRIYFKY